MALCQDQHGLLEGWDQGCCCRVPFHAGVKQVVIEFAEKRARYPLANNTQCVVTPEALRV